MYESLKEELLNSCVLMISSNLGTGSQEMRRQPHLGTNIQAQKSYYETTPLVLLILIPLCEY